MGWPENTALLKTFYPTSVLVTGFDILFFWVARMMMMGLHFMKAVPFKDVYVHALVRDEEGKKMSKSKGNVIDPLEIIDEYGTDAFRFTLAAFAAQGRDVKMSKQRVEGYRHFVNKLWNAARFSMMHETDPAGAIDPKHRSMPDCWILSRLRHVTEQVTQALDTYRFNDAAGALYQFVWHEFCDWYLEAIKPVLYNMEAPETRSASIAVLQQVLRETLILLHPFIPFVTEEIWQKLSPGAGSIMTASYPLARADETGIIRDAEAEARMDRVIQVITGVRNIRGEMNIPPSLALEVIVQSPDEKIRETITAFTDIVSSLAKLKSLTVAASGERPPAAATAITDGATIYVPLAGILDVEKETRRLKKEIDKLAGELTGVTQKLANQGFLDQAPADVVEKVRERHALLTEKQQNLLTTLKKIEAL
jgi:valyl-tRNA synthetase